MIELNLLPKELRKKKKSPVYMPKLPMVPVVSGIVVVLILMHLLLLLLSANNRHLLKSLKAKWTEMKPQREKTEEMTEQIADLEKKNSVIRSIAKKDLDWTRLLSGLNQAVIPNIWLSNFELKFETKEKTQETAGLPASLHLTGFALGNSDDATSRVAKFINSLKATSDFAEYFKDIEPQNIKSSKLSNEEVMIFELNCRFK